MISYRPSIGNNETKVGVTSDGKFFGKSTGGKLLLNLRTNDEPKATYYKNNYTDLSNDSSWFFKSITDNDFILGSATYRAIYIGASERHTENEILGTIATSVTNDNGDILLDNSVTTSLWVEGVYTELTSDGSISLQDENDRYHQLTGATWTSSVAYNGVLLPGQFIKVWIKTVVPLNASIVDFSDYNYFVTIGDLVITVRKTPSRISYSRLFKANLESDSVVLKEALSSEFGTLNYDGIFKLIKKDNYVNVFYHKDSGSQFNLLVAKVGDNLGEYKYIDIPLTPIFEDSQILKDENYQKYLELMTCELPLTINITDSETYDISGASITIASSGAGNYVTELADILPSKKFIVDVFISKKEDINYAYIYYAELHTDYTTRDILNYQNIFYKWVLKVATIDLNHINDKLFSKIEVGYDNKHNSIITSYYDEVIKHYFFPSNIILQDDMFTIAGFETEDCYFKNYKAKLLYVWEKDLILRDLHVQESLLPRNDYSSFRTVKNEVETPTILKFDNLTQVSPTTDFNRSFISGSYNFVNIGAPHTKEIKHGTSAVMYDLENSQIKEYNTTWSFAIDSTNLTVSGDKITTIGYDLFDPKSIHAAYASDYINISGGSSVSISGSNFKDQYVSIFSLNCQDDTTQKALDVTYNFQTDTWEINGYDADGNIIINDISGEGSPILSTNQQSVVTVDIFTHEVSGGTTTEYYEGGYRINNGCLKRHVINYKIYVNGKFLIDSVTRSLNNVNIYQITHNPNGQFVGSVSYWDIRKPVEDLESYVSALHKVHLNTVWPVLDIEKTVKTSNPMFNNFNCRRKVTLRHLTPFKDTMVIPLVLYGNSYNMTSLNGNTLNSEVTRNVFDFNKLSLNKKSFGFFTDKTYVPLEFEVQPYDFDNDIIVIWLRLENWQGEAIQMFYSDAILEKPDSNNIFESYYGFWRMDAFIKENLNRISNQRVFDVGETVLMTQKDRNIYLTLINNIVRFGNSELYKSNYFDVEFDDNDVVKTQMDPVTSFISENVRLFKPSFMEIRDIKSLYDYKLETNNTGDS